MGRRAGDAPEAGAAHFHKRPELLEVPRLERDLLDVCASVGGRKGEWRRGEGMGVGGRRGTADVHCEVKSAHQRSLVSASSISSVSSASCTVRLIMYETLAGWEGKG